MEKQKIVYLDYAETTPMSNEVYREMIDAYGSIYASAKSAYKSGRESEILLEKARTRVAKAIGAEESEIYFTSGGSESNNWAIKGIARANKHKGNHIITSVIEHPSVLKSCKALEKEGFSVTYVPVDEFGVIKYSEIVKSIGPKTILISIMSANGEVGTIQPIKAIAELAKANKVVFHTDATQAIGSIDFNVKDIGIDALSITGHKIYGPKGVGALYVKKGVAIENLIDGGSQEGGKRAGTENVPSIVGLGKAVEQITENVEENNRQMRSLRRYFLKQISSLIHNVEQNGHATQRLQNSASITFEGADGEAVMMMLDKEGIYVSTPSESASDDAEHAHILLEMGKDIETVNSTIRFSFGKTTTKEDVDYVAEKIRKAVKKVRSISAIRIYKNKVEL